MRVLVLRRKHRGTSCEIAQERKNKFPELSDGYATGQICDGMFFCLHNNGRLHSGQYETATATKKGISPPLQHTYLVAPLEYVSLLFKYVTGAVAPPKKTHQPNKLMRGWQPESRHRSETA
ncbi:hypothetical protein HNY73_007991 [Argiope bruennichi]|uniref:Uncharacterized protein n=1 Tax=Argiope bruennichi TaxID=94029 RepID=A0A8T0FA56_ARGBR|nr:hypothetical protein HNY73_007991 [Argiope bruennichi]